MAFQYTKRKGVGYRQLLESVKRVNSDIAKLTKQAADSAEKQNLDMATIESVKAAITNGIIVKGEIVKFVTSTSSVSRRAVMSVMDEYDGSAWVSEKGVKNASIYKLLNGYSSPVSFL